MKIINKIYNLKNKINAQIVLISDIHFYDENDLKRLNKVLHQIKKINPDYICIPGDLTDISNIKDENKLIDWLKELSNISKVIISIGNHEFYINKAKKIFGLNTKLLNKIKNINNLYLLDNENKIIDNINFIGLTIPMEYYYNNNVDFNMCLKYIKTNKKYYNILLCHSPINISKKEIIYKIKVDLILCGHMHGGITPRILRPIFKNRGIISPRYKLFPKIAYGHLKINNTDIIISSGVTVISHINKYRFLSSLFSSEIVQIKIIKD